LRNLIFSEEMRKNTLGRRKIQKHDWYSCNVRYERRFKKGDNFSEFEQMKSPKMKIFNILPLHNDKKMNVKKNYLVEKDQRNAVKKKEFLIVKAFETEWEERIACTNQSTYWK